MKNFIFVTLLAIAALITTSCQKTASQAANSNCITNPSSCNSSLYQQSNGYSTYSNSSNPFYYYNNTAYLCNCPSGTIPTYNSYSGLGCVQSYYTNTYFGAYAYLYIGWNSNQWSSLSQLNSFNYNTYYQCHNGAVQSCVVGQVNICPLGTYCHESSAGSSVGLCVTSYR